MGSLRSGDWLSRVTVKRHCCASHLVKIVAVHPRLATTYDHDQCIVYIVDAVPGIDCRQYMTTPSAPQTLPVPHAARQTDAIVLTRNYGLKLCGGGQDI